MMYAHVTNGAVDAVGRPPDTTWAGGRWYDLRTLDPTALAACGWVPATPTSRPADTATTTWDSSWAVSGGTATQVWAERPKTQAELDSGTIATNTAALLAKAGTALATNGTYLAIANPTNAQAVAQVQRLTRQVNALLRLARRDILTTDGT